MVKVLAFRFGSTFIARSSTYKCWRALFANIFLMSYLSLSLSFYLNSISSQYQNYPHPVPARWLVKTGKICPTLRGKPWTYLLLVKYLWDVWKYWLHCTLWSISVSQFPDIFKGWKHFTGISGTAKCLLKIIFREVQRCSPNMFRLQSPELEPAKQVGLGLRFGFTLRNN